MLIFSLLKWKVVSWCSVETMLAYTHTLPEKLDGQKSFQDGEKMVLNGSVRVRRYPLEVVLGVQNALQGKNKELEDDTLKSESDNSNGMELFGWFDVTYRVSPKFDLQVLGDVRNYGESDRKLESNGLPFEGSRLRYAIGPGAAYILNEHLAWNAAAKYFVMEQDPDFRDDQNLTFRGVNVSVGMTYTF